VAFAVWGFLHEAHEKVNSATVASEGRQINADEARIGLFRRAAVLNYTFRLNGETYHGEARIPESIVNKVATELRESRTIPILYLPSNPSVNYPAEWQDSGSIPWSLCLLPVLSIVVRIAQGIEIHKNWKLARHGSDALGTVLGYKFSRNGTPSLKYEFRDSDDLLTEGRGYYPTPIGKGSQIRVLYSPEESRENRPYPLFFFRAVK
jgi:hypothetical protein